MKELRKEYVKRSQKDYSMSFKLWVVSAIEGGEVTVSCAKKKYGAQGSQTITNRLRKYGTFDRGNQTPSNMPESKDLKILELEQKINVLENQKAFLEKQAENSDKKAVFLMRWQI